MVSPCKSIFPTEEPLERVLPLEVTFLVPDKFVDFENEMDVVLFLSTAFLAVFRLSSWKASLFVSSLTYPTLLIYDFDNKYNL